MSRCAYFSLYRAELADILRETLNVGIEKTKTAFEIKGVSKPLMEEFSKRREAILTEMENAGATRAVRAAHFTLTTREKKRTLREKYYLRNGRKSDAKKNFLSTVVGQDNIFTLTRLC